MAEAKRKPLIQPGSMIQPQDTMARILKRDREASGREATEEPEVAVQEPIVEEPVSREADTLTDNITSKLTSNIADEPAAPPAKKGRERPKQSLRQRVAEMAESRHVVISLRCPEALNDWLDEYAHAHRKQGVKKQDLIAEAIGLLILKKEGAEQPPEEIE